MITKQKAIEILCDEPCPMTPREAVEALDHAGAFSCELDSDCRPVELSNDGWPAGVTPETLTEINRVAREIIENDHRLTVDDLGMSKVATLALRLASACRAAGLVSP